MKAGTGPFNGKRVTLMGLGRHGGGVAAARWLAGQGCRLTITDLASADDLAASLEQLGTISIDRLTLGRHDEEDFTSAEMIVVNPAVKPGHPLVSAAHARGAMITSETELFLARCPATVVGITGTTGKSTTATMLHRMLLASERRAWLGGNIGVSLLNELPRITATDVVVLELSSFQLAHLSEQARLPAIAVVTNASSNHLDWHGTWDGYVAAKKRLLASPMATVVLNTEDAEVAQWHVESGSVLELIADSLVGTLHLPGIHNRHNARMAATVARHLGIGDEAIRNALVDFTGLPHRLELVGEVADRRFFNDSKATSPAATVAALASMDCPTWLLAGGVGKGVDFQALAQQIVRRAKGAVFYGTSARHLSDLVRGESSDFPLKVTISLGEAMDWAFRHSRPGETILLSPACASFDQYRDFEHRGRDFVSAVRRLATLGTA